MLVRNRETKKQNKTKMKYIFMTTKLRKKENKEGLPEQKSRKYLIRQKSLISSAQS